jgi:hypothetical protein
MGQTMKWKGSRSEIDGKNDGKGDKNAVVFFNCKM